MSSEDILGTCPECGVDIPRFSLLIEYSKSTEEKEMFAECPECEAVVHPE